MATLAEKQLRRRQAVLAAARELLSEHGYEGVTMRRLASQCGVSTKFLYDTYQNKDDLLAKAIGERLELVYERIETRNRDAGAAHLANLCEGIAEAMLEFPSFAHAFASTVLSEKTLVVRDAGSVAIVRRCVEDIRSAGELVGPIDVDLVCQMIQLQITLVIWQWHLGTISDANLSHVLKLCAGHVLKTLTTGQAQAFFLSLERDAYSEIGSRLGA
ncbi:MAG: TetR/AcrR family transcriptional regulator [Caulobacterales bacterium]|nr:TetR/AcrR family transcriptional regulator [Caulobacterales bacterium]